MRVLEQVVMGIWHTDKDVSQVCAKLREAGLSTPICSRVEMLANIEISNTLLRHFLQADVGDGHEGQSTISTLWIVDDKALANRLRQSNHAVLICLHEGNATQDFYEFPYAVEGFENLDVGYLEQVYRRHVGMPWEILTTKHCSLRETTIEDLEAFYQIYAEPSMTEYMENLFPDKEQEKAYLQEYIKQQYGFYGFGVWTVRLLETNEIIGRAGLFYREGYEIPELGFLIGVPWQGQGLATEVCEAILTYGLNEMSFHSVQALVMPGNIASEAVCKKLRMEPKDMVCEQGITYRRWIWNIEGSKEE